MAKKIRWNIDIEGEEHKVALEYSMLFGKAIVEIDGDKFDISTGLFKLRGTSQIFKLGDTAALLEFPKKGAPAVIIEGERQNASKG